MRLVIPGFPYHITQRGKRRQQTCFHEEDYGVESRAGRVADAAEWRWSSARPHLSGRDDRLVRVAPMLAMVPGWRALLDSEIREDELRGFREHGRTGRPLGSATFVEDLEQLVGRILGPRKPDRKPKLLKQPN